MGLSAYQEAVRIDRRAFLQMQIADYLLNNNDRHEQNWGFFMDNKSGQLPDIAHFLTMTMAFAAYPDVMSQTTEEPILLREAAIQAQKKLHLDLMFWMR